MEKLVFRLPEDDISDIIKNVDLKYGNYMKKEELNQAQVLLEETYLYLAKNMNDDELSAEVRCIKRFGDIRLEIAARGEEANPIVPLTEWIEDESDLYTANVLKINRDRFGYSRVNGENIISIEIHDGGGRRLRNTGIAIVGGLLFGIAMRMFVGPEVYEWLETNVSDTVVAMFMRPLKMMVPLLVFSAITLGLTSLSKTADIGRIGVRMICQATSLMFMVSIIAVTLGTLLFPGSLSHLADIFETTEELPAAAGFSLTKIILDIIPNNIVDPLRGGNIMQVFFLAIFFGIVLNRMGEKAAIAREMLLFVNKFSMNVMTVIVRFIPLVVFCSIAKVAFRTDVTVFLSLGKIVAGNVMAVPLCWCLFSLVLAFYGKLSPGRFIKKLIEFAPQPISISSSTGSLAQTMKFAEERLGISGILTSFALPLGIQFHKAGTCFSIALPTIMVARVCDVPFTPEFLIKLIISLTIFVSTTPGVVGGGLIVMSTIFSILGLPQGMIPFFLCISSINAMFNVIVNVSCNLTSVLLTSIKENMLDHDVYKRA